jgi:hypothetical protein
MILYTYTVKHDRGAAPNPFFDICTLAICKPKIRLTAEPGDWIAGFGSKNVEGIDYSGRLVYAMKVNKSMLFSEYDILCRKSLEGKIPDVTHKDIRRRVGDCVFDFEKDPNGKLRLSVHTLKNRREDLSGKNVLLSDHFYYFGDKAAEVPEQLSALIIQQQGHRSTMNDPWKHQFVDWIESTFEANTLYGSPQVNDSKTHQRAKGEKDEC